MINPDRVIQDALNSHTLPEYHWFFSALTWLGDAGLWLIILAGCMLVSRWQKIAAVLFIVLAFSVVINTDIKHIVQRNRPEGVSIIGYFTGTSYSFPSGHTQTAFVLATVLVAFLERRYCLITYMLAIGVGMSRMYLGVHYFTDAVAGAVTGTLIGILALYALYGLGLYNRESILHTAFRTGVRKVKPPGKDLLTKEAVVIGAGGFLAVLTSWLGAYLISLGLIVIMYVIVILLPSLSRNPASA
jgi:undecaprenyl-diphosphatase